MKKRNTIIAMGAIVLILAVVFIALASTLPGRNSFPRVFGYSGSEVSKIQLSVIEGESAAEISDPEKIREFLAFFSKTTAEKTDGPSAAVRTGAGVRVTFFDKSGTVADFHLLSDDCAYRLNDQTWYLISGTADESVADLMQKFFR